MAINFEIKSIKSVLNDWFKWPIGAFVPNEMNKMKGKSESEWVFDGINFGIGLQWFLAISLQCILSLVY